MDRQTDRWTDRQTDRHTDRLNWNYYLLHMQMVTRLHSSRMHTTRLLTVSPSMHWVGGLLWGAGPGGCVFAPGGGAWWGGWYLSMHWGRSSLLWTEFLTHATENITLAQTSFAGGNNSSVFSCVSYILKRYVPFPIDLIIDYFKPYGLNSYKWKHAVNEIYCIFNIWVLLFVQLRKGEIGNNWKLPPDEPYTLSLATFEKVLAHNVVVNLSMFNLVRHYGTVSPKWNGPSATSTKITGELDLDVIIKLLFSCNFSFIKIGLEKYCRKKNRFVSLFWNQFIKNHWRLQFNFLTLCFCNRAVSGASRM